MRKIMGDGLRAPHENATDDRYASLFVLGKSNRPQAAFAAETILEIEVDGDKYLVPLDLVFKMIDRAINRPEAPR